MLRLRGLATLIIIGLFAALVPGVAHGDPGDIGVPGPSWSGARADPSGSKPESKLWWNDGSWWGSLYDTGSNDFHIFRLNTSTQTWANTGVALDDRPESRADVLWDGTHLYVASHIYTTSPGAAVGAGEASRLYRYSYNTATDTYSLDVGFPVVINNYKSETLVIDKDSTGKLWATWTQTQDRQVWLNRTTGNDQSWGIPFVPAVAGTSIAADDISSVVPFGGNKIGLMWSNQSASAMYFAVHVDGQSDGTWEASRTALQGPKNADDHINLKSLQSDGSGRVFAAIKTSHTTAASPLVMLLVRNPSTGDWASHVYGRVSEEHTRPIVLLDEQAGAIHMFATAPSAAFPSDDAAIYEKTTPINNISFDAGYGTPVIKDADVPEMNDATSTKQNVNATTGLVVLASNATTRRYWHHYASLGGTGTPTGPTANFTASATSGPTPLAVNFTDTSTGAPTSWAWNFGDGGTSTLQNPAHNYTAAGTYTVSLTVGNTAGTDIESKPNMITAGAQTLTPVADAYVKDNAVTKNYGRAAYLRVRSSGPIIRSYVQFDVAGVSGTVTSARLRLRVKDTGTDGGNVYSVADNWTETGITWSNAPVLPGGTPLAGIGGAVATAGTWVDVDVTSAVTEAVTGDDRVSLAVAGGSTNAVDYDSRESANDPQLIVTASSGPVAPAASFTASPTSGTAPLDVSFTDTSTGTPDSWAWDFGDTGTSTQQSPAHTYAAAGTYTVSLEVDYAGTPSTASQVITVLSSPPPGSTFTFTPVADAYVKSDSTGSNYGTANNLRVRSGSTTLVSYLKFDVSGLSGPAVTAKLRLRVADTGADGGRVYLAGNTWTETGITWSNAPALGAAGASIGLTGGVGTWIEINVPVTGNGTWTLAVADGGTDPVWYDSRESANAPQLLIDS